MRQIWATVLTMSMLAFLPSTAYAAPTCGGKTATMVGTTGNDTFYGTANNDIVYLGDGDDRFFTGAYGGVAGGVDLVCGGNGKDWIITEGTSSGIWGGSGNDSLAGNAATNVVYGGDGNDNIKGNGGTKDRYYGGAGSDSLAFTGTQALLDGGYGADTAQLGLTPTAGVRLDLPNQRLTWQGVNARVVSLENAFTSQFPDTLIGTAGANNFTVDPGDTVSTGGGADTIDGVFGWGRPGTATINTGSGNDWVWIGFAANISLGSGADRVTIEPDATGTVDGGTGNDRFESKGAMSIVGGGDYDDVFMGYMSGPLNINLATTQATGPKGAFTISGTEKLYASTYNDVIVGSDRSDYIKSGDGNDQVWGGGGNDRIELGYKSGTAWGGPGDDYLVGTAQPDTFYGEAGRDKLMAASPGDKCNSVEVQTGCTAF